MGASHSQYGSRRTEFLVGLDHVRGCAGGPLAARSSPQLINQSTVGSNLVRLKQVAVINQINGQY